MKRAACVLVRRTVPWGIFELTEVLSVSRRDNPFAFGLPGGKAEDGESLKQTAIREMCEEVLSIDIPSEDDLHPVYSAQCGNYWVTTYECSKPVGDRFRQGDAGPVFWVPWSALINIDGVSQAPFADYNQGLMRVVGDSPMPLDPMQKKFMKNKYLFSSSFGWEDSNRFGI